MRTRLALLSIFAASLTAFPALGRAAGQFRINAEPVFQGLLNQARVNPVQVEVQNSGSDARGFLRVSGGSGTTSYPIDLPRGSDKRIIVYPTPQYDNVQIDLVTDQGNAHAEAKLLHSDENGLHLLLITDDSPGELGFVRTNGAAAQPGSDTQTQIWDMYSKPGQSPNRPLGYHGISAIILGPGAERMTDEEVQAVKDWLITGRTILFVGGASAPILQDRRWSGVLPAHDFHVAQLMSSNVLANLGSSTSPSATVTTGAINNGALGKKDGNTLVYAEQPFGLGRAVYLSFNPFDAPLNKWEGRKAALMRMLRVTDGLAAGSYISTYAPVETNINMYRGYGGMSRISYSAFPGAMPPGSIENDPFETKLPPTERIFFVLVAYFLAVIPLNFLVLKKLKRGELAWFTAPIISFIFACILFTSAASLYGAKMSTVSSGLIIAQEGNNEGVFIGSTQMFIPRAGAYDLKLNQVDSLTEGGTDDMYGARDDENSDIEAVDTGEITIPNLSANNLNFRRIGYRQLIPISKQFHVRLQQMSGGGLQCTVTNNSLFNLTKAQLAYKKQIHEIGELKPGESKTVDIQPAAPGETNDLSPGDVRNFTNRMPRAALTGALYGFRPGPQLGVDLAAKSTINFAMFSAMEGN